MRSPGTASERGGAGIARFGPRRRAVEAAVVALLTGSCTSGSPSVLSPEGDSARRVDGLWWLMLWISAAVFVVVVVLMAAAIVRRRRRGLEVDASEPRWGEPFVVVAGVLIPVVVLTAVFVVSLRDMNAIAGGDPAFTVRVTGHMWWWEAAYPNGAVTANEIHIPTGEPVRFEVTSQDVIHSFWVPQLAPKIDMIPGRTNSIIVRTETPGRYRGQCAEFCGLQHANMAFFVTAQPPAEFETWLAQQARPAATPSNPAALRGMQVFLTSSCSGCHTIRGTDASGTLGPDLTHLAGRETIAAGTLRNTPPDLERWISDPQSVKPGAVMPPNQLNGSDLAALLDYLESLR